MRFTAVSLVASLGLGVLGCGSDGDSVGVNGYEYVAGSYSGPVSAADGGATFSGTLSIDVEQLDDANNALTGTYSLYGTVTGGPSPGPYNTGYIVFANAVAGANPLFSLQLDGFSCFLGGASARYAGANRRLVITDGHFRISPPGDCSVSLYDFVNVTGEIIRR